MALGFLQIELRNCRLENLHIVIHGEDLNNSGEYDGRISTLGVGIPLEAELPVACGTID